MRVLVISDIHANLAAFEAVLADAGGQWDIIWCLGDVIGYGPDPNECVSLLREHNHISLSGNHDWAVLNKLDVTTFNQVARFAISWTQSVVTDETRDYLDALPSKIVIDDTPFTLAHASPRQPVWEYILEPDTASINFDYFETPYCLVGHTHVPVIFAENGRHACQSIMPDYSQPTPLDATRRIINPGSVGQPRDADPRAAYAFLDTETLVWEYKRVDYPISRTQEKMRKAGMPPRLVERLAYGW